MSKVENPKEPGRRKVFYKTLAEAQKKARKLNATSAIDYRIKCRMDPLLHLNPNKFYLDWEDWYVFLDKKRPIKKVRVAKPRYNHYPTMAEAMAVVKKERIKRPGQYQDLTKKNPRLHTRPWKFYADTWKGWRHFFGLKPEEFTRDTDNYYKSYGEASKAAQKLGATSFRTYVKVYAQDPRLHSNPNTRYKDEWRGWKHFLGVKDNRYKTISAASRAAVKLDIKNARDYVKRYRLDPRLHSTPYVFYADEWIDWPTFLKQENR